MPQKNPVAFKLTNHLANAINEVGRPNSVYQLVDSLRDISSALNKWEEHIRWNAQTIHQAYHLELAENWETCPRNTCNSAQQALGIEKETHETTLEKRLLKEGFPPDVVAAIVESGTTGDAGPELSTE